MNKPTYTLQSSSDNLQYVFESVSNEKKISKAVAYIKSEDDSEVYQLIFGDLAQNGDIDVLSVSNNDDMKLVLSTVVSTLFVFFENYPGATVAFTGSTQSRTRLYRAVISKFINETELYYQVLGITENSYLEPFDNQVLYVGYLITQKQ